MGVFHLNEPAKNLCVSYTKPRAGGRSLQGTVQWEILKHQGKFAALQMRIFFQEVHHVNSGFSQLSL